MLDEFGNDFEKLKKGFIGFLLLDDYAFPVVVLEAKSEDKSPLDGKEQARKYAQSQNVRFVILTNGNLHYFWDLQHGNPNVITKFPTLDMLYKIFYSQFYKRQQHQLSGMPPALKGARKSDCAPTRRNSPSGGVS